MIRALIAVALLATPAAAQAPQAPTLGDILEICRIGTFEDRAKALGLLNALPEEMKPVARLMCASYQVGSEERLRRIQAIKGVRYI